MNQSTTRCLSACEPMSLRSTSIVLLMLATVGLVAVGQQVLSQHSLNASEVPHLAGSAPQMLISLSHNA